MNNPELQGGNGKMQTFEPVANGIYLLKTPFNGLWSGVYLIRREKNILIDSGASAETVDNTILPALKMLGLTPADLSFLLCTHTHGDHIGGHHRIKELAGIPCGVFEGGLDKLRNPLKYSKLIRNSFPEHSPAPPSVLRGVEPDFLLRDSETLGPLKLIHTPGHDTDTVCFLDRETRTLLTGDSIQGNGTILQGCALYMDLPGYRDSMKKLQGESVDAIVMGHPYLPWNTPVLRNEKAADCLKNALEITDFYDTIISNLIQGGETDPVKLAEHLIRTIGGQMPRHLFLALHTVEEHRKRWKKPQESKTKNC